MAPEDLGEPPRRARLSREGRRNVAASVAVAAGIALLGLFFGGRYVLFLAALRDRGRVAPARVDDVWYSTGRNPSWMVEYDLDLSGYGVKEREALDHGRTYPGLVAGGTYSATYLPDDPARHRFGVVDDGVVARGRFATSVGLGVVALLAGVVCLATASSSFRQRAALERGRAVVATVDSVGTTSKGSCFLGLRFPGPSGEVRTRVLANGPTFATVAAGDALTVLVLPGGAYDPVPLAGIVEAELVE